ncbi:MAG: hypothetical protein HZY76_23035 [Anaerolineae bacterium]|nr:MAG: hypothetical protein HZY76_23035 [Anaerolineae bacterium]
MSRSYCWGAPLHGAHRQPARGATVALTPPANLPTAAPTSQPPIATPTAADRLPSTSAAPATPTTRPTAVHTPVSSAQPTPVVPASPTPGFDLAALQAVMLDEINADRAAAG